MERLKVSGQVWTWDAARRAFIDEASGYAPNDLAPKLDRMLAQRRTKDELAKLRKLIELFEGVESRTRFRWLAYLNERYGRHD